VFGIAGTLHAMQVLVIQNKTSCIPGTRHTVAIPLFSANERRIAREVSSKCTSYPSRPTSVRFEDIFATGYLKHQFILFVFFATIHCTSAFKVLVIDAR